MKKIIFSFDDGLEDFYQNVFPILKKYNIKATLNVITGFSDKTFINEYCCCTKEQLGELLSYGIELANHSDNHVYPENIDGYDVAQKKLNKWFPNNKVIGVVTPYTQNPPSEIYKWCNDNSIRYIRIGDIGCTKFQQFLIKKRLISHFRLYCFNNSHYKKREGIKIVYSFPVFASEPVSYYKKIIEASCLNPKITFMFHSILASEKQFASCPYPKGAWTTKKFEELVQWILKKGYKICCQSEAI